MVATRKAFEFSALPRELRDLILSDPALFGTYQYTEDEITLSFSIQRTILLLISHSFSHEYTQAFTKNISLKIKDTGHAPDIEETATPLEARAAKSLSLELTIACTPDCQPSQCDISDEMILYISALRRIVAQVPRVRTVEVALYIRPHADVARARQAISVGARNLVKSDQKVKELSIFTVGTVDSRFEVAWRSGVRE